MSVLKYFKNIPRSPPIGRQALSVIFFLQIRNEVPGKKKGPVAHPTGDRGLSPTPGATESPFPYISPGRHMPPSPLSFEPKNSGKKERGEEKKSGEALPNCVLVIYR